jgi:hypothetical protein
VKPVFENYTLHYIHAYGALMCNIYVKDTMPIPIPYFMVKLDAL